jgi:hypothetical protein
MDFRGMLAPGTRRAYALAGRATITMVGKSARFTYRIKQAMKDDKPVDMWFVSLLTGPDNYQDYQYIGVLRGEEAKFGLTAKSKLSSDAPGVQAMIWISRNWESLAMEVWHEGVCGRCGRKLTVPESIALGIGPVCATGGRD